MSRRSGAELGRLPGPVNRTHTSTASSGTPLVALMIDFAGGTTLRRKRPGLARASLAMCVLVVAGALVSACGGSGNPRPGVATVVGTRIPGTSPANWRPFKACQRDCGGFVTAVFSQGRYAGQQVVVFQFRDSQSASEFYSDPDQLNKFQVLGVVEALARSEKGPVAQPSRWLALRFCAAQANDPEGAPEGAPVGEPDESGHCVRGALAPLGVASVTQRGDVVIDVQAASSRMSSPKDLADNAAMTNATLTLLHARGVV